MPDDRRSSGTVLAAFGTGHKDDTSDKIMYGFEASIALRELDGNTLMKQMVLFFQYVDKVPLRVRPLPFHRDLLV